MARVVTSFLVAGMVAWLATAAVATATTIEIVDFHCPLCATHFRQRMTMSSTSWGARLDLMPIGNGSQPWPRARCPKCNLLLFKDFSPAELKRLRPFIQSPEYVALAKERSDYDLLAKTEEYLGAGHFDLAMLLLEASWEYEANGNFWRRAVTESLAHLDAYLRSAATGAANRVTASLVRGELLRRLGRFDEAGAHFAALAKRAPGLKRKYGDYFEQEVRLILAKDRDPHARGELPPEKLRELALPIVRAAPGYTDLEALFDIRGAHVEMSDSNLSPERLIVDQLVPRSTEKPIVEASYSTSISTFFGTKVDWQPVVRAYSQVRSAILRHSWIIRWLEGGADRVARAELTPLWSREIGQVDDWGRRYPLLRLADSRPRADERRFEVGLYCGQRLGATLLLADADGAALVVEAGGCEGEHFIDRQKVRRSLFSGDYFPEYLVVEKDGRFRRNVQPASSTACPAELCKEPCAESQSACSSSVLFFCLRGKIQFFDPNSGGETRYTCGDQPDGRKGILGLAGASCDPLLRPDPRFCAPGLTCIDERCAPVPDGGATAP